jgi:hypothetical protein
MTMSAIVNLLLGIQLISSEAVFKTQDAYVQQVLNVLVHVQARLEQTDVIDDMIDDLLYQLLSKLEGVIEDSEMTLGQYEGITEQLKLISQDMNEHVGEQIKNQAICYRLTSGSYYGALEENQASAPAGNRYMAMKKNELTSLMKDCFNEDSKWIQRARIAHLLTVANITQTNPKEIYEFMLGNFAPCKNQTEKSQSQKLIRILMSEV